MGKIKISPAPSPTIMVVASEASGDRLAAPILAQLKKEYPGVKFVGVGGPAMVQQGLHSLLPMQHLAVMGLTDVLPSLPRIWGHLHTLQRWARQNRPALCLTIDGSTFSAALRKRVHPLGIPCVHYVVPKVWAWQQGRVHGLKKYLTHLFAELPLGLPLFQKAGIPTTYVGHAGIQHLLTQKPPAHRAFQLALLPGSRRAEIQRHWPIMLATFTRLQKLHPQLTGLLVLPTAQHQQLVQQLGPFQHLPIQVVVGEQRFKAMAKCQAALAKSGTITLELAAMHVPTVIMYRTGWLTYVVAKALIKVPYIGLPNILLNQCLFPEFIQRAATPTNLARALHPLLQHPPAKRLQQQLHKLKSILVVSQPPAQAIAQHLRSYLQASPSHRP